VENNEPEVQVCLRFPSDQMLVIGLWMVQNGWLMEGGLVGWLCR